MLEKCLTPSVKHGGGNVMVWGCFGGGKVGDLYRVKGILKKEGYHSILQRHAILCGRRLIGANFLLQQDNDPKHSSKLCKNYLGKKQSAGILSIMEWPAQSQPYWEQLGCLAMIGSVFCHLWGHYIIAKFMSLVRIDIQNFSPLGPAIELCYKCPSKKAQDLWPQIK